MKLFIHTDGGARGNPGPAASGIVIKDEQKNILAHYGEYLGETTNNVAEYSAVVSGLKKAKVLGATDIVVISDSKLVIEQLKQNWKVKDIKLQKLFIECWNLLAPFKTKTFLHVLRDKNKEADKEVNIVLDAHSKDLSKPVGDFQQV
jgi:ribonuclease HI